MSLLKGVGEFFALDIGTSALRLIQLAGDAEHGFKLTNYAFVPVDRKIVQDNSELGQRKMGEVILGAIKQAGIKTKNVAIGLPAGKTYTAVIEVPNQTEKELKRSIKYELDQYIPMAVDEAEVDYTVLGPSPNDPNKAEVLITSTPMDYAESSMELIEKVGLNVIAQEPEPIAMARSLAPVGSMDARIIVDLGEMSTDIVVVYKGAPRLVRSIPGGLVALVRTVATTLNVREDQARRFILKFGLAQDKLDGQVFKALDGNLDAFAQELTKSVRFFQNKYVGAPVLGIVLSGFAGMIPFIAEYIEVKTNVQTIQGNPWQLVQVTPEQQRALISVASEFAVAIGLAERSNA
ncbi:type IV pilus assembly protein PilM [Candidatus Saccharibacteria bacterium]|nr:type IV pilus assembly protein PilM [Candidatus Saccharibacteria bacterium]